jgi:succinate dehydrogenase/fumarate reductase cytochrome b subunit
LAGTLPLTAFLLLHLFDMWRGSRSRVAFETGLGRPPWPLALEIVLLWLPLAVHAGYGILLLGRGQTLEPTPPTRVIRVVTRSAAWLTLTFIAWHFVTLRLSVALGYVAQDAVFDVLCASLSSTIAGGIPLTALGYALGLAATIFHAVRGLGRVAHAWTPLRPHARAVDISLRVLGVAAFLWGLNSVVVFATGSNLLLSPVSTQLGY